MILKETILSAFNERGTLLKWLKKVEKLITEKVLVKPVNNPQSTEIVAVNSTGEQVMLEVGTGLTIDNGVLKFANVYDGTVVIEKANSVLGLRRFKDTITPISEYIGTGIDYEGLASFCEPLSFDIEPIEGVYVEDATYTKMTCVFTAIIDGETFLGYGLYMGEDSWISDDLSNPAEPITQFNVLSTANSTVDEWLLANTEGVSV